MSEKLEQCEAFILGDSNTPSRCRNGFFTNGACRGFAGIPHCLSEARTARDFAPWGGVPPEIRRALDAAALETVDSGS